MIIEETKKKAISQRGLGNNVPAHLNDMAFFDDSILDYEEKSNEQTVNNGRYTGFVLSVLKYFLYISQGCKNSV